MLTKENIYLSINKEIKKYLTSLARFKNEQHLSETS